jgi:hypothetical protein
MDTEILQELGEVFKISKGEIEITMKEGHMICCKWWVKQLN